MTGFPWWLSGKKNPPANAGDMGSVCGWEDPTCHGVTKPVHHNYWACVLESRSCNCWAHVSQLLKPERHRACAPQSPLQWEAFKLQLEKNPHSNKDPAQPKINKIIKKKNTWIEYRGNQEDVAWDKVAKPVHFMNYVNTGSYEPDLEKEMSTHSSTLA